jgi:hypothetical protein
MLSEHPVYVWQKKELAGVSSLNLSIADAEKVLNYMYGANTESDYMSPTIDPDKLVFWRDNFSHLAADMFLTNMTPALVEFPQMKGNEELIFSLLIQCKDGFTAFRRDKNQKLADSNLEKKAFHSIYGHRTAHELASLDDVVVITDKTAGEMSELLGHEFNGLATVNTDYVNPYKPLRVYIDTRYLVENWHDMNQQQEFNHSVWAVMDYMHKSNDTARLTMLIHNDDACVSRLCAYN